MAGPDPQPVFPPTLREVMVRPRWLALLALCLVVAGVFAWLGQWQLARAVDVEPPEPGATEQVRPLDEVVEPGAYLPDPLVGQRVAVRGAFVPDDFVVVSSRFNDGVEGYWVTGQFRLADRATPTSLAVAVGWTPDRQRADAAASTLSRQTSSTPVELVGRLIADEGPALPPRGASPTEITRMSPPALLSRWTDTAELAVYRPYLVSAEALGGLEPIASPAPAARSSVNWLNIFYAVEWAVFAGFAFYLWYRLARDAWEKEVEAIDEARAASAT